MIMDNVQIDNTLFPGHLILLTEKCSIRRKATRALGQNMAALAHFI
jgi:hypothetical protein